MAEIARHPDKRVTWASDQLASDGLSSFVRLIPTPVAVLDRHLCLVAASDSWLRRHEPDSRPGQKSRQDTPQPAAFSGLPEGWRNYCADALAGAAVSCARAQVTLATGDTAWVSWEITPILGPGDQILGLMAATRDLSQTGVHHSTQDDRNSTANHARQGVETDPNGAEQANRALQSVLEASLNGIMAFTSVRAEDNRITDFEWVFVNRRGAELVARSQESLVGKHLLAELPGHRDQGLFEVYTDVVQDQRPVTFQIYYPHDGLDLWFDISAVPLDDGLVVTFSDITPIKRAESAVRVSEARLASILTTAPIGVMTIGADQTIAMANEEAARIFGSTVANLVNRPIADFIPHRHREQHAPLARSFLAGPDRGLEMSNWRVVNGLRGDGSEFPMLALLRKITVDGMPITTFVCRDMTEIRDREEKLASLAETSVQDRLRTEQANSAKSRFLASMSHELRTPLNAILGFSELMLSVGAGTGLSETNERYLNHIHKSGRLLHRLIEDLMDIAQIETGTKRVHPRRIDLDVELQESLAIAEPALVAAEVAVVLDPSNIACHVRFDPTSFKQILINLLGNAARYVPAGGAVTISLVPGGIVPEANQAAEMMTLELKDSGPGYPEHVLRQIGSRFLDGIERLDEAQGTGLGLSIVRGLVELNGGVLRLDNPADGGARVRISLPLAKT